MRDGPGKGTRDEPDPFDVRSSLIRGGCLGGMTYLVLLAGLGALLAEIVPPWSLWVFMGIAFVFALAFAFEGLRALRRHEPGMRKRRIEDDEVSQ